MKVVTVVEANELDFCTRKSLSHQPSDTLHPAGHGVPTVARLERMHGFGLHEQERPAGPRHARSGLRSSYSGDVQVGHRVPSKKPGRVERRAGISLDATREAENYFLLALHGSLVLVLSKLGLSTG